MVALEWLHDELLVRALLAATFAGVACACVGVLVVTMRLSFLGVCMSHAAFAGALAGYCLGLPPLVTALAVSAVAASALGPLADRGEFGPDTAMGIVFSASLGLTFLLLALIPGPKAEALTLLWGSVLTVSRAHLILLAGVAVAVAGLAALYFRQIQAVIFDRELAAAAGVPAAAVVYGLLLASGLVVTASLQAVGGLLVFSLIVNPAAAAYQLTYSLRRMFFLAAALGVLSTWLGLALSCVWNLPAGAVIVVVSALVFLAATLCSPKRRAPRMERTPDDDTR